MAKIIVSALSSSAEGIYYVCEEKNYTWEFFTAEMAKAMGVKKPALISLPRPVVFLAAYIYKFFSRITARECFFGPDKAREACAGNWISSPKKWMIETGFNSWTSLTQGLNKTFRG
ncbi:MAG: hypothetical protein NTW04_04460 [Elusimicrobia bacterium]|nr:hypothetical protein [Elusimicrobiota bacterium]